MNPAQRARSALSLCMLHTLVLWTAALSSPRASASTGNSATSPLVRQVGPPVALEFDGRNYLQYAECASGSRDYRALERLFNSCAVPCAEPDGCPRGCCLSLLNGAQLLFCEESGRCMRTARQTDGSSMFLTLERYEIGRFSGELNCPLGDLRIGSNGACAVKIVGDGSGPAGGELSCRDGVDVPNTAQLTDTDTCKLDDQQTPELRKDGQRSAADCFPADATVSLLSGKSKRMDELEAGDVVHVGGLSYSPVHMFSHKLPRGAHDFVRIVTAAGATVRLSPGHLLPVNGALSSARTVTRGDTVQLADGRESAVRAVSKVSAHGLYNPHTLDGRIVVDGVACSVYTDAVNAGVAHAVLLAPCRLVWRLLGVECGGRLLHGNSRAGVVLRAAWVGFGSALERNNL